MSLYNVIFGQNPSSDVLLAMLGLNRGKVGRFRDCFVVDGKICVYTRNGGGNRRCWHRDSPEFGSPECRHEVKIVDEEETIEMPQEEAEASGLELGAHIFGDRRMRVVYTGKTIRAKRYVCLNPASEDCHCVGCFMTHHVHKIPNYSHDRDDDFDHTYATIYFNFPPQFNEILKAMDSGKEFDPDAAWKDALEKMEQGLAPEVEAAMKPIVDALKRLTE